MARRVVLVVEDDPAVHRLLRAQLEVEGYRVSASAETEDALRRLDAERPDLVVLGIHSSGLDGLSALRHIRERSRVPVMVVSEIESSRGKVTALDLGADDYVIRPFDLDEFLARVRALLRRSTGDSGPPQDLLELNGLAIDLGRRCLLVDGREVSLSRTEWQLLYQLATNLDRVMLHRDLLSKVWGPPFTDDVQYLRVWVSRLRRKMGESSGHPRFLVTIPGVGYRLCRSRDGPPKTSRS